MYKLKPCPWCGSAAVVISNKLGLTPQWYVRCPNHDKADEVRKETAKEILQEVSAYLEYKEYVWFRELCGKYGVER